LESEYIVNEAIFGAEKKEYNGLKILIKGEV
jgi:hypothetical protein